MNAKDTRNLVELTGGNKAFACELGIVTEPGYQQRINRWKHRGISAGCMWMYQRDIKRLARKHGIRIVLVP